MNSEIARYILVYFSNLMTVHEKIALKHLNTLSKIHDDPQRVTIYEKKGWLSKDTKVLQLIEEGSEQFGFKVAQRILKERPQAVYFNTCKKCGELTRTPQSRQCKCGYLWHDTVTARFKLHTCFELTKSHFFLVGRITHGTAQVGHYIDLTTLRMACHPQIKAIEWALKKTDGLATDDICLGVDELTQEQKEAIKNRAPFNSVLEILRQK